MTIVGREVGVVGNERTLRLTTYGLRVSAELWGPQRVQELETDDRGVHTVVDRDTGPAVNPDGPGSVFEDSRLDGEAAAAKLVAAFAMPSSSKRYVDVLVSSSSDSEVGHLFGARHDVFVEPSSTPFAYGHGYVKQITVLGTTLGFNTVMAYTDDPLCDTDGDGDTDDCQQLKLWFFDANDNGNWDGCGTDICRGPYGTGLTFKGVLHPQGHLGYLDTGTGYWHFDADDDEIVDACGGGDLCYGPFGGGTDFPLIFADGSIGTFNAGTWHLDNNGNGQWNGCVTDTCATFGQALDQAVLTPDGDIGVYRKSTGLWYFDSNSDLAWSGCSIDTCLGPFGAVGDRPVVTVDGQIGLFRPSTGQWFFDVNSDGLWNGCGVDRCVGNMGAFTDWAIDAVGSVTLP